MHPFDFSIGNAKTNHPESTIAIVIVSICLYCIRLIFTVMYKLSIRLKRWNLLNSSANLERIHTPTHSLTFSVSLSLILYVYVSVHVPVSVSLCSSLCPFNLGFAKMLIHCKATNIKAQKCTPL